MGGVVGVGVEFGVAVGAVLRGGVTVPELVSAEVSGIGSAGDVELGVAEGVELGGGVGVAGAI